MEGVVKKAIAYLRVSTKDQSDRGYSLPTQEQECRYCRQTWAQSDSEIWAMIPLKWWLDEGMISEDKIPAVVLVTMRA